MNHRERLRQRLKGPESVRSESESAAASPRVQVHINELLLNGFSPSGRYEVGDAFQTELTRLFSDQGIPQPLTGPAKYARLDAGTLSARRDDPASTIGSLVANAVYRTFQPGPKGGPK